MWIRRFAGRLFLSLAVLASSLLPIISHAVGGDENLRVCLDGSLSVLCDHSRLSDEEAKRVAEAERRDNLRKCLDGSLSVLCDHTRLSPEERKRVEEAERKDNLKKCLDGSLSVLCDHSRLTGPEAERVREAERKDNLKKCLDGSLSVLCDRSRLSKEEAGRAEAAEQRENVRICLDGCFPSLCERSALNDAQRADALAAERLAKAAGRCKKRRGRTGGCESGHWIDWIADGGAKIGLEDGSIWEVDSIDTIDSGLWLPISDISICGDKLINTDDGEAVGAQRIH